jgi:LDH2 family malate/lactate/ureidoglycolate dehydrogenase
MTATAQDIRVPIDRLLAFAEALLTSVDVPADDAGLTARILLDADLRGVESHGMAHLVDFYVRGLQHGRINPRPNVHSTREAPAAAAIDGDRGLGFVVGHRAMARAIDMARATGAGMVSAGNSTHYGAGAYYAMMALDHEMIGISMTTGGKLMTAPGGCERAVGLNVFCVAAPTPREYPYVLDMATSVVAAGKLEIAARRGRTIPEGWAVDAEGHPLTDPTKLHPTGALLPLGGAPASGAFKGFGLTLMVDIFSAALSDFATTAEGQEPLAAAHFFGALRIDAFEPVARYMERMDAMIAALKQRPAGDGEVRIPGELEHALAERRRADGAIPLHPRIIEGYKAAAGEFAVPFDFADAS